MLSSYDNYRMDNRTEEEFMEDILEGAIIERDIIERYARYVLRVYGISIVITDNGCDNSGEFLLEGQVNTKADYLINSKPCEIKHFKPNFGELPVKSGPMQKYLDQGARILLVNGYNSTQPKFTLIQPEQIREIIDTMAPVPYAPWGGKMVYMLHKDNFKWNNLDK